MIIISEKIELGIEATEANRVIDNLQNRIDGTQDKIVSMAKTTESQTKESFKAVVDMMKTSYMLVQGITQVIGGDLGQMFGAIYGVAVAGISTYQAIAAAMAASGVGTVQAILMMSSLIAAGASLGAIMTGQTELSRRVGGINMTLQALGQSISSWGI